MSSEKKIEHQLISGPLPAKLGNAVSTAIHEALSQGMKTDEAACVVVAVACDYARHAYGNGFLDYLAYVVLMRAEQSMLPSSTSPAASREGES